MQNFKNDFIKGFKLLPLWGRVLVVACYLIALSLGTLNLVWQYNNPKANQLTFWTHFGDVVQLKKLEKFQ